MLVQPQATLPWSISDAGVEAWVISFVEARWMRSGWLRAGVSWKCPPDLPPPQMGPTRNTAPGEGCVQQVPEKVNLPSFWLFQVSGTLWDA